MYDFATQVKTNLLQLIHNVSQISYLFCQNPKADFTRNRKLSFETMIHMMLTMEGGTLSKEMLEYTNFSNNTASVSAFNQQRKKIMPQAMEFLFHQFNDLYPSTKKYKGYNLIACDGSALNICRNTEDKNTYFPSTKKKGFNQLHLNAFYNILERRYTDALIQPGRKINEYSAMATMIDRSTIEGKTIVIADRGYESYNIFAHAEKKNWNYLIRVKDIASNGIVANINIPEEDEFDIVINTILTRKQTDEVKKNKNRYRFIPNKSPFDYLDLHKNKFYPMSFRVVRVKISENNYECLITNLDEKQFSPENLKELYYMRWGIETSFRELKYAIGVTNFHAKKVPYIIQEIFAKMTMYNFCELITTNVVINQKETKHVYQVNYTMAIHICRYFLKILDNSKTLNVNQLIQRYILPIRLGRNDPRKVKVQSSVSFLYRVA